jgi:hypoxanthine phosphoribosyltransferase
VEIATDYEGLEPILIASLKTALVFVADLSRALPIVHNLDFIALAGYEGNGASGRQVRLLKDLGMSINGRHVLLVEDIVDTGLTLSYLLGVLGSREPASIEVCTLLDKSVRRIVPLEPRYVGFDCPDRFVIGYGLDFRERYRHVPDILAVDDVGALEADPDALVRLVSGDGPDVR